MKQHITLDDLAELHSEVKINKSDIESNIDVKIDLEGTSKICPICGVILEEDELEKDRKEDKTIYCPNGSIIKFSKYTDDTSTYKGQG